MIFVPLPFIAALFLLALLIAFLRNDDSPVENWPFAALLAASMLQSLIVGLRWGYGFTELRFVMPVVACTIPPLAYLSFRRLIDRSIEGSLAQWGQVALWPCLLGALLWIAPATIDAYLVCLFLGYAAAILRLGGAGPDTLEHARLNSADRAHKAILLAAASLAVSALFDLSVLLDFRWSHGENSALIATNVNLLGVFLIGLTAWVAARARPADRRPEDSAAISTSGQDKEVLDRIEALLADRKLYLDESLTLSRLARRAGLPARQISGAINRLTGKNVSQYINDFRIGEA